MKIHTLEIVNFKSYFGRHIIGPIDNHFACIIGPNGNGKSNILDAMLFVFGFKSSKLRQDSLASLIHSSAYGMPEEAKVSVTFVGATVDNNKYEGEFSQKHDVDEFFRESEKNQFLNTKSNKYKEKQKVQQKQQQPLEQQQKQFITISRTIRKTNQSFYELNNKRIQWNELREFLLKQHIDLEKNLFIILQGEVERLCELSPEKLVEYIEYVSGSDRYLERIHILEKEYISGGIDMDRVKQSYKLFKKVYTQHENEAYELLEHVGVRIKLVSLSVIGLKRSLSLHNKELIKEQQLLKEVQQHLASIEHTLCKYKQELETLNKESNKNTTSIAQHEQTISKINEEITAIESQHIKKLETEIEYLIKDCKQREKEMDILERERMELEKMEGMKEEIGVRAQEIEDVLFKIVGDQNIAGEMIELKSNTKKETEIKEIHEKKANHHLSNTNKKKLQKQKRIKSPSEKEQKEQQQIFQEQEESLSPKSSTNKTTLTPEYKRLRQIIKQQESITKIKQQLSTQYTKELEFKERNYKQLQEYLESLIKQYGPNGELYKSREEQISTIKVKLRQLLETEQKKEKEVQLITQSMDEINRRIKDTEEKRSFVTMTQKIINELKTANSYNVLLPGKKLITLREVVHIPTEYSQFINAITPQLDFIIAENHNDAREVIKFLNSKKLGRMSLILLDEVKKIMSGIVMEWKGERPLNCVRMVDVVKVIDNEYERILYWSMGNTLIAERVEDAMTAAYHSNPPYRVIAKNSVFIDLSGTMTKVPLQSMVQEDRTLLDTRAKVLQKKLDEEMKRLLSIREEKEIMNKELYELMNRRNNNHMILNARRKEEEPNERNRSREQHEHEHEEFTTRQELTQFINTMKEEITQLEKEITHIKGNKATIELEIKIKQKELDELIKEVKLKLEKMTHVKNNKLTFVELLQMVEEYENMLSKLKKIQISEQLINSLDLKLHKVKEEIKSIITKIEEKQNNISHLQTNIKEKQYKISQLVKEKIELIDKQSKIEQNIFVKELDIKYLNGEVEKESINNNKDDGENKRYVKKENNFVNKRNHNNNNRKYKNVYHQEQQQLSHSLMPDIEVFEGQQKEFIKYQSEEQGENNPQEKTSSTSVSIHQIRKEQKRLKETVEILERKIKSEEKHYKHSLQSLKNIYQFFIQNCKHDQEEAERQEEEQRINKNEIQKEEEEEITNIKKQNIVSFKDIIIDYIKVNNLVDPNEIEKLLGEKLNINNIKYNLEGNDRKDTNKNKEKSSSQQEQSSKVSRSKSSPLQLKSTFSNQLEYHFHDEKEKLIFNSFFNSFKLANIGPKDSFVFSDLLSEIEIDYIIKRKLQLQEHHLLNSNTLQEQHKQNRIKEKEDILMQITVERLRTLTESYQKRMQELENQSSSLVIKNIQHSPLRGKSGNQLIFINDNQEEFEEHEHMHDIDIDNHKYNYNNNHSIFHYEYFSDPQYPLNSSEQEIINTLIEKKKDFLLTEKEFLLKEKQQKLIYTELLAIRQQRTTCFLSTFNMINIQVNKIYNFLTKGNAEINLVNSIDPFEGLEFTVRPFNKSWKSVNLLSGGEKTLTSLALIFACEEIKKFPFYFMDEIDAALDYRNVTNLGKYIKSKQNVQHIVISLRKNMYEQCDQLVCLYKVSDVTRTIVVGMEELYGRRREDEQEMKKKEIEYTQSQQSNASTVTL